MSKVLCIYCKSENIKTNQFDEVIDFFKDDVAKNTCQDFRDDKVIIISKSSISEYNSIFELNQTLFFHTGTLYPSFLPTYKSELHEEKMNYLAETYFKFGSKGIAQFNGFFNLVIYNKQTK